MTRRPSFLLLALATLAVMTACDSYPSPVVSDATPSQVANALSRTADSLNKLGDSSRAAPFTLAADVIRAGGNPTAVTILEDGTPRSYQAVAQRYLLPPTGCGFTPPVNPASGTVINLPPPGCGLGSTPAVVAWRTDTTGRMLTIFAPDGASQIGLVPLALSNSPFVSFNTNAMVMSRPPSPPWIATTGGVNITRPAATVACPTALRLPPGAVGSCALGDFTVGFDLTAEELARPGTAGVAHRLSLAPRLVGGVVVTITSAGSPIPVTIPTGGSFGPVNIPGLPPTVSPMLAGLLDASVNGHTVTFTFTVKNLSDQGITASFANGQRYGIVARDAAGQTVWASALGVLWVQSTGTETIAAHGSLSYTATWNSAPSGRYVVIGSLTSNSHHADGSTVVTVP